MYMEPRPCTKQLPVDVYVDLSVSGACVHLVCEFLWNLRKRECLEDSCHL